MRIRAWILFGATLASAIAAEPSALRPAPSIPLPGVSGRFDHFAVDLAGQRLFVAALGNNTVEVMDIAAGKRLKTITGLRKPQGVAYLPARNQLIVASGGDGTVKFFDASTYAAGPFLSSLDDADNVRIDVAEEMVYVGFGDGALAVIDTMTAKQTAVIKLDGHPESFQLEREGRRIFVNVPDSKQVAVVDRQTRSVVAKWPLPDFHANYPMALDETNHRLFIGCRSPARLVVLDTTSGRRVADLAIVGDTDDLFYDAARKRIYVAGGDGTIDVIEQRDADHYAVREHLTTSAGARTAYFSADLLTLFLAVPQRGGQGAEIRSYKVP
jgi:DNA-binding beta-propeller fold protein YncE